MQLHVSDVGGGSAAAKKSIPYNTPLIIPQLRRFFYISYEYKSKTCERERERIPTACVYVPPHGAAAAAGTAAQRQYNFYIN
jgi:hypothetical protein